MSPAALATTAKLIPFPRRAAGEAPAVVVRLDAGDRISPPPTRLRNVRLTIGLIVGSLGLHAAVIAALLQPAAPLDGVAIPAIAVDIVLGNDTPAGLASVPALENAVELKPGELTPLAVATAAPEFIDRERVAAVEPREAAPAAVATAHPAEIRPDKVQTKPVPRRRAAPSARAQASSGIGLGGSSRANPNYYGEVAAHLARYKRFPDDARGKGDQGSALVRFSLNGRGEVTSVKLTRSSGSAPLDREAQAMVFRASPFPPPPDGRPQSFAVPVSFSIR